jgi:iron complex outermembrane receptor protein
MLSSRPSTTSESFMRSLLMFASVSALSFSAHAADVDPSSLLDMSLAELSNIEVTSVSKKAEKETEAAAAIYVITQEDIKNSGATAIPELFRMVPGMTVTQSGAHDWTVTARGFNDQFSNKLLVLIDGRTVYSPLFSGVIWENQDTVLEDIERIEVIRGPGATLWGANAVNGVINIITKHAKDTQGGYASLSAGNQVHGIGDVRYGGKIGEDSYVRAYAKSTNYASQERPTGVTANDNWEKQQAGFRSDSKITDTGTLNVQGDIYTINQDTNYTIPDMNSATGVSPAGGYEVRGGNIQTRWEEKLSAKSIASLQMYVDSVFQKSSFFNDLTTTADIDFQHSWTGWNRQEIVWGTGYRLIQGRNDPTSQQYSLDPQVRNDNLFSAFVQDKVALIPDNLYLTLGSKIEHNDYTGVEVQPSARIAWLPTESQTVWGSVSRAVHTPSRYTDDATQLLLVDPVTTAPFPLRYIAVPNRALESEEMVAYELGYRIQPTKTLAFDVASFYNDYKDLFGGVPSAPTFTGTTVDVSIPAANTNSAKSMGLELSSKWNVSNRWQLAGSYSYITLEFEDKANFGYSFVGKNPKHQFNMRSTYLFPRNISMSNALYYVDDLSGVNIDGYYRFDTRISYPILENVDLSLVGQNLFDNRHQEFTPFAYKSAAEVGRSVYGNVSVKF